MESPFPRLYLISPGRHAEGFDLVAAARSAFEGGARMLQVRERHLRDRALAELVSALIDAARPYDARILVNAGAGEGIRVARRLKAGVHLGSAWPVAGVRKELQGLLVGASTHDAQAVAAAVAGGADFVTLSPIFDPDGAVEPAGAGALGIEGFRGAVAGVTRPVFALGGITPSRVPDALAAGATGVAVMSFVFDPAWDPGATAGGGQDGVDPRSPAARVRRLLEALS